MDSLTAKKLVLLLLCLPSLIFAMDFSDPKSEKDLDNPFFPFSKSSMISQTSSSSDIINAFKVSPNTIIRTKESRSMGAKYLNESTAKSRDDCFSWCWRTKSRDSSCNLAVYEESKQKACYLFDCGSIENFKCKFTSHDSYTSSFLNRASDDLSDWKDQSVHENQLLSLKEDVKKMSPPSTTSTPKKNNCQHFQFACKNSSECIAIYNVCDGIPQCPDGSDEGPELHCTSKDPVKGTKSGEEFDLMDVSKKEQEDHHRLLPETKELPLQGELSTQLPINTVRFMESPSSYNYPKAGSPDQRSPLPNSERKINLPISEPFNRHRYNSFVPAAGQYPSSSSQQQSFQPLDPSRQQESQGKYSSQSQASHFPEYFNPASAATSSNGDVKASNSQDRLRQTQQQSSPFFDGDNYQYPRQSDGSSSPLLWSVIGAVDRNRNIDDRNLRGEAGQQQAIMGNGNSILDDNSLILPKGFGANDVDSGDSSYKSLFYPKNPQTSLYPVNDPDIAGSRQPTYDNRLFESALREKESGMIDRSSSNGNNNNNVYQRFNDPLFLPSSSSSDSSSSAIRKQMLYPQQHQAPQHKQKVFIPQSAVVHSSPVSYARNSAGNSVSHESSLSLSRNEVPILAVSHLRDSDPSGRDTNSAVIALTLGLSITAMLIALVGCRMNSIKKRIARRGGRGSLAHDADYLINGMYL